jgi:hypothetical protein
MRNVRYAAHCVDCRDPAPFDTVTERDRWVTEHAPAHNVLTSTEYRR